MGVSVNKDDLSMKDGAGLEVNAPGDAQIAVEIDSASIERQADEAEVLGEAISFREDTDSNVIQFNNPDYIINDESNDVDNDEETPANEIDEVNEYLEEHSHNVEHPIEVNLKRSNTNCLTEFEKKNIELKVLMRNIKVPKHGQEQLIKFFNSYMSTPECGRKYFLLYITYIQLKQSI